MNIFDFLKFIFEKDLMLGLFITAGFCLTFNKLVDKVNKLKGKNL